MIDTNTTLCRAQYYAEDGLAGSGVITEIEADGKVKLSSHIWPHVLFESFVMCCLFRLL